MSRVVASSGPHAIVLAAGLGTRLGRGPKALLAWNDEVLVTRAARAARDAGCSVAVAVGPGSAVARMLLGERCPEAQVIEVHDAAQGMSASLRAATLPLSAAPRLPEATVVLLVDQPGVDAEVIAHLLQAHRRGRVTRASWAGVPGNPVVFDTGHLLSAAAAAAGDAGARVWLRRYPHLIDDIACDAYGRGDDVDVAADLATWPELAS